MPTSGSGSRGGLITAVVIFTVLFVAATIFAIYYHAELSRTQLDFDAYRKRYADIISAGDLVKPEVKELQNFASGPDAARFNVNRQMKAMEIALAQRDGLSQVLTGSVQPPVIAANIAERAIYDANQALGKALGEEHKAPLESTNLAAAIDRLTKEVIRRHELVQTLRADSKTDKAKIEQIIKDKDAQIEAKQKEIEAARAEQAKAVESVASDRSQKQTQIEEIEKTRDTERKAATDNLEKKNVEIAQRNRELDQVKALVEQLKTRLARYRPDPTGPVMRQADGVIVRLPGGNIAYINRGQGDQMVAGMTFEVYDKNEGIPPISADATQETLPRGKASIEVLRVGPTSSECRIVKQTPGYTLTEGDVIVNLVYDPRTRYQFMIYGDFDLDGNGLATAADAEVVKRLVTQWGGKLIDKVNVETDFVVMGMEPKVPAFTDEELKDPINKKKFDDATVAMEAYLNVKGKAVELKIPVLNQNRFLYLVGYWDQARR